MECVHVGMHAYAVAYMCTNERLGKWDKMEESWEEIKIKE